MVGIPRSWKLSAPSYVYVTRKGFPSARNMQNENELIERLEKVRIHMCRSA